MLQYICCITHEGVNKILFYGGYYLSFDFLSILLPLCLLNTMVNLSVENLLKHIAQYL